MIKCYSDLIQLKSFSERLEYLKLGGCVGAETFGFDRVFYQRFLKSSEFKRIRYQVIARDNGCDLGIPGHEIYTGCKTIIHHMNPSTMDDLQNNIDALLNPEYLITTILDTHNSIHYGSEKSINLPTDRSRNDMCPWL